MWGSFKGYLQRDVVSIDTCSSPLLGYGLLWTYLWFHFRRTPWNICPYLFAFLKNFHENVGWDLVPKSKGHPQPSITHKLMGIRRHMVRPIRGFKPLLNHDFKRNMAFQLTPEDQSPRTSIHSVFFTNRQWFSQMGNDFIFGGFINIFSYFV